MMAKQTGDHTQCTGGSDCLWARDGGVHCIFRVYSNKELCLHPYRVPRPVLGAFSRVN